MCSIRRPASWPPSTWPRTGSGFRCTDLLGNCRVFVHGSTIATNTILERKGAVVGLLTTEGFRDALEIRRGIREDAWDHRTPFPHVLVPRHLRLPVRERMDKDGRPVSRAGSGQRRRGARGVPARGRDLDCDLPSQQLSQRQPRAGLRGADPQELARGMAVRISPISRRCIGEYERTSTTVLNAYVTPRVVPYLQELERESAGARPGLSASADPEQWRSGERRATGRSRGDARAVGTGRGRQRASRHGRDGRPERSRADGDRRNQLRRHPDGWRRNRDGRFTCRSTTIISRCRRWIFTPSAAAAARSPSSMPAVCCTSVRTARALVRGLPATVFGGENPTVTDAQLVLGRMRAGAFANGLITLDAAHARSRRSNSKVASRLGLDVVTAASGIIRLLEQSLQHAIERVSVERGYDPRRFTLVAGGGAGALHAVAVARALGCPKVYVPRLAGVFCAFGMCSTDIREDFLETWLKPLDEEAGRRRRARFSRTRLARAGRGWPSADSRLSDLSFERACRSALCRPAMVVAGAGRRIGTWRDPRRLRGPASSASSVTISRMGRSRSFISGLSGSRRLSRVRRPDRPMTKIAPVPYERRSVYLDARSGFQMVPIYDGNQMRPGQKLNGPALIEESNTTILIGAGDRLEIDASDNFLIHVAAAGGAAAMIDDPIGLALVQKQLDHIARQMGWVMTRTARSPIFSQSHDFSCFIGDAQGNVVSQADGLPIHTGGGGFAIKAVIESFADEIADGDVFILNDPYEAGGNHLPDYTIVRPVFVRGELLAFCCNRAHQSDIGGGAAGTYNSAATEIFHEGIRLPVLRLVDARNAAQGSLAAAAPQLALSGSARRRSARHDRFDRDRRNARRRGAVVVTGRRRRADYLQGILDYAERLVLDEIGGLRERRL